MKKSVKSIVVLVSICAVVSVLLALTNAVTAPIITQNEEKSANAALLEVLPDGGSFEKADITANTLPATVTDVYLSENGGKMIIRASDTERYQGEFYDKYCEIERKASTLYAQITNNPTDLTIQQKIYSR